ncbi:CoA transferase [Saccharopolyspora sp. K220]|uniref:CaiB/BaiF CoA transferase family protein n=1 Tax=Saccharopolyspora soli TaxID=2926618 RepID=UPI001F570769|nr:CoA transferase [Saccharopolyspora soli]MCI2417874.1 CoA transferase [Saccharopolyspora soli]
MDGSLRGLRVLDITASVAGPFATQILGDLGADVIKVERVEGGDDTRRWGPPFWCDESPMFLSLNRNKRSLALELKSAAGQEVLRRLIAESDVLVQNLRPGSLAKLGFDYERLREINPRLIYCDMTGYGHTGPLRDRPAYDPLMQAFSGLMSITGEPGRTPVRIPASLLDQGTAMWTVIGVLDALRVRDATGEGSVVQTSLLQTALMWLPSQLTGYLASGELPVKQGSGTQVIAPYQAFPTADGHLVVAAGNDNLWRRLCAAIGRDELSFDARFVDNPSRVANREELVETLSETLRKRTSAEWQEILGETGVPITAIRTLDEVVEDEQVQAVGILARAEHPRIPDFTVINTPICRDGEYLGTPSAPPQLGEHTEEILTELGFRGAEVEELVNSEVVARAGSGRETR